MKQCLALALALAPAPDQGQPPPPQTADGSTRDTRPGAWAWVVPISWLLVVSCYVLVRGGGYSTRIRCLFLAVAFARLRFALRSLLALACVCRVPVAYRVCSYSARSLVCGSWSCVCTMA
jgi:hypothetical protein